MTIAAGELGEATFPEDESPAAVTVCVMVAGGVRLRVWHTYPKLEPAAKLFPGTGTGPEQSVGEDPKFGSELLTVMPETGSAPVLVTTTRHQTVPYTVADEAQSTPLIGWVGSQEGPTDNVHTCTTAEIESVAADAGVGVHAGNANRSNKSPPPRQNRKRGVAPLFI